MFLRQAMLRLFGVAWTSPAMILERLGESGRLPDAGHRRSTFVVI
jgi:hypothetical protein